MCNSATVSHRSTREERTPPYMAQGCSQSILLYIEKNVSPCIISSYDVHKTLHARNELDVSHVIEPREMIELDSDTVHLNPTVLLLVDILCVTKIQREP